MHIKAKNEYNGSKSCNNLVYFYDFPWPRPDSITFQAWEIPRLYAPCKSHANTDSKRENNSINSILQ